VQNRVTGQLEEEKMQVYVRLGIRLLYKVCFFSLAVSRPTQADGSWNGIGCFKSDGGWSGYVALPLGGVYCSC
jgi:hypothetical protein